MLQKQRDRDEEKALLARDTELVNAKLRDQAEALHRQALQAQEAPDMKVRTQKHLLACDLKHQVDYKQRQIEQLEKDTSKVEAEIGRTLDLAQQEDFNKYQNGRQMLDTVKQIHEEHSVHDAIESNCRD